MEHAKCFVFYLIMAMGLIGFSVLGWAQYTQEPVIISAPISPLVGGKR